MSFRKIDEKENDFYGESTLFVYGLDKNDLEVVKKVAKSLNFSHLVCLSKNLMNEKLENLIGKDPLEIYETQTKDEACIILYCSDAMLSGFITSFRKYVTKPILFASLNEINAKWTFSNLLKELKNEREAFRKRKSEGLHK